MATTGRLICARCGSNNFDTQAACWKCGTPLGVGGAAGAAPSPSRIATAPRNPGAAAPAAAAPPAAGAPAKAAAVRPAAPGVDPAVANWIGVISGVLMPYVMLPVGIVFMMLDDRRRFDVGRVTVIASLVGTLLHLFLTGLMLAPLFQMGSKILGPLLGGERAVLQQSAPDWNQEVSPLDLSSSGLRPVAPPPPPAPR